MTQKEKFLKIETYEEFDRRREEFKGLGLADLEVRKHLSKIFGKASDTKEELYRTRPYDQCTSGCAHWGGYNGCGLYREVFKEKPDLSDGKLCSYRATEGKELNKKG